MEPGTAPNVQADTTLPELHQRLMGVISPVIADVASASQYPSVSSSARETGFQFLFIVSGTPRISLRACFFFNTIDNYTDRAPLHRIPGAWAGARAGPPWGSFTSVPCSVCCPLSPEPRPLALPTRMTASLDSWSPCLRLPAPPALGRVLWPRRAPDVCPQAPGGSSCLALVPCTPPTGHLLTRRSSPLRDHGPRWKDPFTPC